MPRGVPGNPVRVGVLGTARVIENVLLGNASATPEIEVVAVASRDRDTAAAFAAQHGIARAWGSYAELLADDGVELVYNALPNSLHAQWSIAALRAGKAVLCEKPVSANADEARAMIAASEGAGQPLIEALHYRHHPLMRHVRELMASGVLGALRSVEVRLNIAGHHFGDDDIRFDLALAGGTMMDLGPYCIDMLRLVSGADGHPEGFLEALANLYRAFARRVRGDTGSAVPGIAQGLRSMAFIDACLASSNANGGWTSIADTGD